MNREKPQNFIGRLLQALDEHSHQRIISKGDFLTREGEVERHLYYIVSGAVRAFLLTEHEEQIIRFGYKGSFINSLSSFMSGSPSPLYIEAIRKTVVRVISKEALENIIYENEESMKGYIALLETLAVQQIEREIDILTVSPSERLKRVLKRSPTLFQEVPLKYIASYLRMTPETLSRIRNS
ncbi:Crp/Fnr family transcriptional regulator [Ferruginibacter sp. HRS2-29]|uniref:Crp/Fnr family transcriptional regulator n=1 Tax=Ferruginibacter sp. HRS2-29 TaxID=2487334 RepID=UPI0020CBE5DB|nr:Crp/Fnr family transcriptional regulator [Ferruginibacter sp. HRS2-29]MCP9751160.1 Crp/Fnr family transcriptional regulator [Ferruginibacter sp. HRS2-29]